MKIVIISLLCLIPLMAGACSSGVKVTPEPTEPQVTPTPLNEQASLPTGKVMEVTEIQTLITDVKEFPEVNEGYGLYGATVTITDIWPGWSGSAPLTIVNGKDYARTFHLTIQQPGSSLQKGYEPLPEKYFSWITIEDLQPKVAIGGVKKVSITLSAPFDFPVELRGKKYDVRILVEDWSQTGFIQNALQEKWLITFAK